MLQKMNYTQAVYSYSNFLPCSNTSSLLSLCEKKKMTKFFWAEKMSDISYKQQKHEKNTAQWRSSYFNFTSSTICSASEKLRTWSPLGRGWTATHNQSQQDNYIQNHQTREFVTHQTKNHSVTLIGTWFSLQFFKLTNKTMREMKTLNSLHWTHFGANV